MRLMRFMLPFVLVASASIAVAADAPKKATSIDELAKMFDSTGCKECHPEIYAAWEKSHHARPFMGVAGGMMLTPVVTDSAFKVEKPEQATLKTFPCFKCHLPQALRWAEDSVAQELAAALMANPQDKAKVAKLQITCQVCHSEKAIAHRLKDGQPKEGVIYGSKERRPRRQDPPEDGEERHPQPVDLLRAVPRHGAELRVRLPRPVRDALRQLPAQLPPGRRPEDPARSATWRRRRTASPTT